jgi:hypothetical protein
LKQDEQATGEIKVLTNRYRLKRAIAFAVFAADEVSDDSAGVTFVPLAAQDVLPQQHILNTVIDIEAYTARVRAEEEGLAMLSRGQYVDSCLATGIEDHRESE